MIRNYKESDIIKIRGKQYKVQVWRGEDSFLRCWECAMRKESGYCNLRRYYTSFLADCTHALPYYYFKRYETSTS